MKNTLLDRQQSKNLLSIYVTAGYPSTNKSVEVLLELEQLGVDFVELGMPYSDPLADGKTIQMSSEVAISNGLTMKKYFDMAEDVSQKTKLPMVYMGYLNPIIQYGPEAFCKKCINVGIDCVIIPDLPIDIYEESYKSIFEKHKLPISFLITPTTSDERIRKIEMLTTGFIYVVSSNAITGKKGQIEDGQLQYLQHIQSLNLSRPTMIGFGIHDRKTFDTACNYANGAIIGSEFIRRLSDDTFREFLKTLKQKS